MKVWVDAQLPPAVAVWLSQRFAIEAKHIVALELLHASDQVIFNAARQAGATVMTKDRDFVELVKQLGAPPQAVWITSGNTSNARLRQILDATFGHALGLLQSGEPFVEIRAGI